jgi:hypothetical protein
MTCLETSGGGKFTLSMTDNVSSNLELMGFALAKMEVLAFKVVMIPAFATEIVCCSYVNI